MDKYIESPFKINRKGSSPRFYPNRTLLSYKHLPQKETIKRFPKLTKDRYLSF